MAFLPIVLFSVGAAGWTATKHHQTTTATTLAFTAGALCLPVKLLACVKSGATGGATKGRNGCAPATTVNAVIAASGSTTTRPNARRSDAEHCGLGDRLGGKLNRRN